MTIAAYQTLYESSVAFGMRKALQAEQGKADMEKRVGFLFIFFLFCHLRTAFAITIKPMFSKHLGKSQNVVA